MAPRKSEQNNSAKPVAKDAGNKNKESKSNLIMKYKLLPKSVLAPYSSEEANPLYTGDLEPDEFLAESALLRAAMRRTVSGS